MTMTYSTYFIFLGITSLVTAIAGLLITRDANNYLKDNNIPLRDPDYHAPTELYTLTDWYTEMDQRHWGIICPWCNDGTQYSPKLAGQRKYRACKACGIFQNVGGLKEQARLAYCDDCKHPGAWTLNKEGKNCDTCGKYITFDL